MNKEQTILRADPYLCIPKVVGADAELGNLVLGFDHLNGTGRLASRALLHEVDGVASTGHAIPSNPGAAWPGHHGTTASHRAATSVGDTNMPATSYNPQDIGRKYLAQNGGCIYIDLDHLEVCTPEVRSAQDFVAAWHAQLRIVRSAQSAANAKRSHNQRIMVLVNSSDGLGNSYGSHLNFLVTRRLFEDLFVRKLHPALFVLAAYQVSSIVFAGQGKVGAEHGRPPVDYQLSQRGDFFDCLVAPQTTYDRPIVNTRDEPLCGPWHGPRGATANGAGLARLHCIFYDSTLCHVATFLKVGVMQIVLCMLEAKRLGAELMLDDPLAALVDYGHDPGLEARAALADGRQLCAVELQSMFCEHARRFVDAGGCDGLVPGAAAIVELWEQTLDLLVQRDFDRLAPRLDWVLKRTQIERALSARGLDWSAPEAKHLDHLYASLNLDEGLFWALEAAGCTQSVASDERIGHFTRAPPDDTRAWARAELLANMPREHIHRVDWDGIDIVLAEHGNAPVRIGLPDPLGDTRAHWDAAVQDTPVSEEVKPLGTAVKPDIN